MLNTNLTLTYLCITYSLERNIKRNDDTFDCKHTDLKINYYDYIIVVIMIIISIMILNREKNVREMIITGFESELFMPIMLL